MDEIPGDADFERADDDEPAFESDKNQKHK